MDLKIIIHIDAIEKIESQRSESITLLDHGEPLARAHPSAFLDSLKFIKLLK
jgi:hypothetical protein